MIVLFGGTTEGRELAAMLTAQGEQVLVCVTSLYAQSLLPEGTNCRVGALDEPAMLAFLQEARPDRVIDATHPYAVCATRNIAACCARLGLPLERVQRAKSADTWHDAVEWADDAAAAARAAQRTDGPILLTTGSKTLPTYAAMLPTDRLWARVLPTHAALDICLDSGLPASHIIAMQGPFSEALNAALYDQLGVRVMITKDSGVSGGTAEKILPALARGIHVIVVRRPG